MNWRTLTLLALLPCSIAAAQPPSEAEMVREFMEWQKIASRIKPGMTESEVRASDPALRRADRNRIVRTASGDDQWLQFRDIRVYLHNGRVASVSYP